MKNMKLPAAGMLGLSLAGLGALCVLTAGCTSSGSSTPPAQAGGSSAYAPSAQSPATPGSSAGDCLLGANGTDVEVGIADSAQSCGQWVQNLAGSGLAWYPITTMAVPGSQAADGDTYQEACDLAGNGSELYVEDAGSMTYGNGICSSEEQNGWTPEGTPGPLASQARQDAASQAAASASASAASASASSARAEANDDTSLDDAAAQTGKDYTQWSADLSTADAAYQAVKAEPLCSGGTSDQTTYDNAQNVYDDGQTVYDDEQALTNDVTTVQSDIRSLQSAEAAAGNANYSGDITAASAVLVKSRTAVNADDSAKIQQEAAAVQTATGNCTLERGGRGS